MLVVNILFQGTLYAHVHGSCMRVQCDGERQVFYRRQPYVSHDEKNWASIYEDLQSSKVGEVEIYRSVPDSLLYDYRLIDPISLTFTSVTLREPVARSYSYYQFFERIKLANNNSFSQTLTFQEQDASGGALPDK